MFNLQVLNLMTVKLIFSKLYKFLNMDMNKKNKKLTFLGNSTKAAARRASRINFNLKSLFIMCVCVSTETISRARSLLVRSNNRNTG